VDIFKPDEAKLTRRLTFFALLIFVIWGGRELGKWLVAIVPGLNKPFLLSESVILPYYAMPLRLGVLAAIILTVVAAIVLYKFLNRERMASLLIETETEMRKVSWPSWADAKQSTVVVLVFVVTTAVYLTVIELGLKRIFDFILI
jgi:preprotein translocase SecE subunit